MDRCRKGPLDQRIVYPRKYVRVKIFQISYEISQFKVLQRQQNRILEYSHGQLEHVEVSLLQRKIAIKSRNIHDTIKTRSHRTFASYPNDLSRDRRIRILSQ